MGSPGNYHQGHWFCSPSLSAAVQGRGCRWVQAMNQGCTVQLVFHGEVWATPCKMSLSHPPCKAALFQADAQFSQARSVLVFFLLWSMRFGKPQPDSGGWILFADFFVAQGMHAVTGPRQSTGVTSHHSCDCGHVRETMTMMASAKCE